MSLVKCSICGRRWDTRKSVVCPICPAPAKEREEKYCDFRTEEQREKYRQWKSRFRYRRADTYSRCETCINRMIIVSCGREYPKCREMGLAPSYHTDIRLVMVCDLFYPAPENSSVGVSE